MPLTLAVLALSSSQEDAKRRMREATDKPVLCEHGHEHDVCCGANQDEVEHEE
jgi:hypothetical protein